MLFTETLRALNRATCEELTAPELAILQRAAVTLRKSGILQLCLQVGETAPDFEFIDNSGEPNSLYQALKKGPVVINFFRGFWCAFCRAELSAFENALNELQSLDVQYLAISPQQAQESPKASASYHVIRDVDNRIARDYGIVFQLQDEQKALFAGWNLMLAKLHESEAWELPLPATYLIGQNRQVLFSFVDADFRKRIDPRELVTFLKEHLPD